MHHSVSSRYCTHTTYLSHIMHPFVSFLFFVFYIYFNLDFVFISIRTRLLYSSQMIFCMCLFMQRKYSQHLKQFGAQTMVHILCMCHLTTLKLEQWFIHGLILALLWLCIILVVHHFHKRERCDIQRPDQKIQMFIYGSSILIIQPQLGNIQ